MGYHSTLFTNKEIQKLFTKKELRNLRLMEIKGKPAKRRWVEVDGKFVTIYGSGFVAKCVKRDETIGPFRKE